MAKLMFRRMAFSGENPILSLFPPPGGREGGGGDNWIKINLSTLGGSIPSYLMNVINLLQIYEAHKQLNTCTHFPFTIKD